MQSSQLKPWTIQSSEILINAPFFKMKKDKCTLPNGSIMPGYYVFEFSNWVNVVPVTSSGRIVLIRQYRHATQEITIEIPGGGVDTSDPDLETAARRELLEETGYSCESIQCLSELTPNPALQSNRIGVYLAIGCTWTQPQNLDPFEDIEVFEAEPPEVLDMLERGEIHHSIVVASLYLALTKLKVLKSIK